MIFGKKRSEKQQENSQRDIVIAYKRVFGSPEGRQVLFDIMNRNFVLNSHKGDALSEGRRAAALEIMHNCHINIEELDRLLKGDSNESTGE